MPHKWAEYFAFQGVFAKDIIANFLGLFKSSAHVPPVSSRTRNRNRAGALRPAEAGGILSARFRRPRMKKLVMIVMLSGGFVLAACNTVEGAGQDVQSVGNAIEDTAD